MKILTARQMAEVDRLSCDEFHLSGEILMENAGFGLYLTLAEYFEEELEQLSVAVLCGGGNNGGDGLVLARHLFDRDVSATTFLFAASGELQGDAKSNFQRLQSRGSPIVKVTTLQDWDEVRGRIGAFDILVDALLGTGANRPLEKGSLLGTVVEDINRSPAWTLGVDIPSGMISDSLRGGSLTVKADATVTFTAPKIAHVLNQDLDALGDLHVVPIGSPRSLLDGNPDHFLELITLEKAAGALPARATSAHKGSFGHAAVLAGSRGKSGAACLCARAAIRSGTGLVTALPPQDIRSEIAVQIPEVMTLGLPSTPGGGFSKESLDPALSFLEGKSAAVLGPGIGLDSGTVSFVQGLVESSPVPLVLDADAINAFSRKLGKLSNRLGQPLILTPHPGEFARLLDRAAGEIPPDAIELSRRFAQEREVWLVLKGFRTLVAAPDGRVFACPLGNPGMATAGMGDALAGLLAGLISWKAQDKGPQAESVTDALCLGVFLHSLAGDIAEERIGPEALNAGDVIDTFGDAFQLLHDSDQ